MLPLPMRKVFSPLCELYPFAIALNVSSITDISTKKHPHI